MSRRSGPSKQQQELDQKDASDLRHVMSTAQGRRFVWGLLSRCRLFQSSYTGNSETFFLEGQRKVGLELMASIHRHCPDLYLAAQKEAMDEAAALRARTEEKAS